MKSINRDKLIVGLLIHDLIDQLNQAMKVRQISLEIDYTKHWLSLWVSMPGVEPEAWMGTDTRKRLCVWGRPANPHLQLFLDDVKERLAKLGGALFLVGQKPRQGPPVAKLQICVEGSNGVAVTLHSTTRGKTSPALTYFIPPVTKA